MASLDDLNNWADNMLRYQASVLKQADSSDDSINKALAYDELMKQLEENQDRHIPRTIDCDECKWEHSRKTTLTRKTLEYDANGRPQFVSYGNCPQCNEQVSFIV